MMAPPTTTWLKLKRRMGCDGNPLRRRTDLIAAWLLPAAVVVFAVLVPLVAGVAGMWVRADNAAALHAEQSWTPVRAVLLQAAAGPAEPGHGANTWTVQAPARWTRDGRPHTGLVPVAAGSRAGSPQTVWLDRGIVQMPPLTPAQVRDRADTATCIAMTAIALLLIGLKGLIRRALDKRRLAAWESDWLSVGPRWSHQGK